MYFTPDDELATILGLEWGVDEEEEKFWSFLVAAVLDFKGDLLPLVGIPFLIGCLILLAGRVDFWPFLAEPGFAAVDFLSYLSWFLADWSRMSDYDC